MPPFVIDRRAILQHGAAAALALASPPALPAFADAPLSEMPAHFTPDESSFDYVRREVKIPMRDRVKLETVIYIPKGRRMRRSS